MFLVCLPILRMQFHMTFSRYHIVPNLFILRCWKSKSIFRRNIPPTIKYLFTFRISEFTNDPTLGNQFASTLLPFVEAGYLRNDDNLSAVLIAIGNFLQLDQNPVEYLNRVAPFLSTFRSRKTRAALVRLLQSLHSNPHLPAKFKGHLKCLQQLEAWHSQRINEPDYEQRHETMAELAKVGVNT